MSKQNTQRHWWIDTNAGPIDRFVGTVDECKSYLERMIPLLRKRGYSCKWRTQDDWHIIDCFNSKGRPVHSAAFRLDDECQWFAHCHRAAVTFRDHTVLGQVPICAECDAKMAALDSSTMPVEQRQSSAAERDQP